MELLDRHIRLDEMIGGGGFGDVYRGYDLRMERSVAVKRAYAMGKQEADMLKGLDCDGLPKIYDVIQENGETYIVMEWIDGIDLERYIEEQGAINEQRAIEIGEEVLNILEYLHSSKPAVIYQDLKPSNIMIKPDGHVMIIDFGTAFRKNYSDDKLHSAGTVGYGSPEQRGLTGTYYADERSDIYSWGAVMYSMLSGRLLSKPPYTMEKVKKVCPHITYGLSRVISKATNRDNYKRFPCVQAVRDALDVGVLINIVMHFCFILLMAAFVMPFVFSWIYASKIGLFRFISGAIAASRALWQMERIEPFWERLRIVLAANSINCLGIFKQCNEKLCCSLGLLIVTSSLAYAGMRFMSKRKYMKIYRSVYLTDKKYPGLWIPALLAGIILGAGLGSSFESKAAQIDTGLLVNKNDGVLPANLYDDDGNKMLVSYDKMINVEGDLLVNIDGDVMSKPGKKQLTLILDNFDSDEQFARTFFVQ